MTEDELVELFAAISNWGRWGAGDQAGTINLITPEVVRRAAGEIRDGITVGCGTLDLSSASRGGSHGEFHMITTGADAEVAGTDFATDSFTVACHGPASTHIDALCHVFFDGVMYNGHPAKLIGDHGADSLAVTTFADGITTRGVLADLTRLRGGAYLEPAEPVTGTELDAALLAQATRVQPGDALLVHVGRAERRHALGPDCEAVDGEFHLAGLSAETLSWLRDHDVALLGSDGGSDVLPGAIGRITMPVHVGAIVYLGLPLIDNLDLRRLLATCRRLDRWSFALQVAPLRIDGGTGSPVNPIAIF